MSSVKHIALTVALLSIFALAVYVGRRADSAEEGSSMKITVGEHQFTVTLEDNATAEALEKHLPMTLVMNELNGNEKYHYTSFSLPTDPCSPGKIQIGDIMLYGDSCLVVFYESFSTPYSYTRIGCIDDTAGLQTAVGAGDI